MFGAVADCLEACPTMKFNLKALFGLVTMVAFLLAVAGYSYKMGMEAGRIKEEREKGDWVYCYFPIEVWEVEPLMNENGFLNENDFSR